MAWSSACCGSVVAVPAMIVGDEKAVFNTSFSYGTRQVDVNSSGLWKKRSEDYTTETFRIEGSHLIADRWQAGFSLPMTRQSQQGEDSTDLVDATLHLGYEFLPDWDYNPWRPKGIGYFQLIVPAGESTYEADHRLGIDGHSRGFWGLGLGTLLSKTVSRWDGYLNFEVHRFFERAMKNQTGKIDLFPGYGGSLSLGAGYNTQKLRLGAGVTWSYEDPIDVKSSFLNSSGAPQRITTGLISVSYLPSSVWSATFSYADQTLLGNPVNAALSQTYGIQVQRRWAR